MSVTIASSIAVPIANKPLRLTLAATTGNSVRLWCSAAPQASKLRAALDKDVSARVHVLDADSGKAFDYTFDVAGAYRFIAQEITEGVPYGGGYQYDPRSAPSEKLLSETGIPFFIAAGLKAQLGVGADTADLILYVSDTQIQATTIAIHGTASPAIQNAKGDKAKTAAQSASVLSAVAQLSGTSAATALGALAAVATQVITTFNAHILSLAFHNSSDNSDNKIPDDFKNPATADALKRTLARILKSLGNHIRNDTTVSTPVGTGSAGWHVIGGINVVDWASLPLFESSSKISEHVRALADAWRSYEAHRVSTAHIAPDNINTLTPLPQLLNVHALFLAELAALSPNAPLTDNSAKTLLVHGAGFEEV